MDQKSHKFAEWTLSQKKEADRGSRSFTTYLEKRQEATFLNMKKKKKNELICCWAHSKNSEVKAEVKQQSF